MKEIVFATGNPDKLREVNDIGQEYGVTFVMPDKGFNPVEDGKTFEENSLIKAKEAYRVSKRMVLADDSGLCVDALNGAPGIFSARYAGDQNEKINKLISEMKGVEKRSARFVCCMTLLNDNGNIMSQSKGICEGSIALNRIGLNGFGFDPVFIVKGTFQTMAELSDNDKNKISHRSIALREILSKLD